MTEVNPLLNSTSAGKLAQQLDAADGTKDGKIDESIWNEFVKDKGGKTVDEFISTEDAMNSITTYVIKEAKANNKEVESLAQDWTTQAPGEAVETGSTGGTGRTQGDTADSGNNTAPQTSAGKAEPLPENHPASKTSTITVSANGLNMGAGMPVDKDGNELKDKNGKRNFKDPKFKEGGSIMKYTHGDKTMYQITYKEKAGAFTSLVKLSAPTIEELQKMEKDFKAAAAKVKSAPANETEEAKKSRTDANLAAFKEMITITGGNIQVIKNIAEKLRDDSYVDRDSGDYKAFVQDLLLTKNAEVVEAMLPLKGDVMGASVIAKDKTAHEILAGSYQEIRNKEKAGEKLSNEEIELKNVLAERKRYSGYKIEADTEKGIHEKYMAYNIDGTPMYQTCIDNNWYYAKDPALLDEFLTKLENADTDAKKAELFKEYINTEDTELAKCLALNVKTLKAKDEDIISLINANGIEVLNNLPLKDDTTYSKTVTDAVVARMKEIYTTDKGNLENAYYLDNLDWIDKTDLSDEDKEKAKTEILETYFEVTQDSEGKKTYTFNPSRRPTYEEMDKLANQNTNSEMKQALVKSIKLEDMGKGQYTEAIEFRYNGQFTVPHYAEMVDKMTTREEVIDFIDNKVATDKGYHLPFDKILEKFPDDEGIKQRLFKAVFGVSSTISDANRLALAKTCMKDDGKGNITFDKSKLPAGTDAYHLAEYVLPKSCKEGDAKKYFEAVLKGLGKDDIDKIDELIEKNPDAVYTRITELVNANQSDNSFIQKAVQYNSPLILDALSKIDASKAKWNDETKKAVFEKIFNGKVRVKTRANELENAVKHNLAVKVANDKYAIGDTLYLTDGNYTGQDNKSGTADDTVWLRKVSKTGYEHGTAMFNELKGAGSGDIAKMLRGKKDEGYENYVTPDNVTGIIKGFNTMSPNEGLMEYIANENSWSAGAVPGKALCNRIPKALMRKAKALGLENTDAYKNMKAFFGADDNFKFTKNDEASERYDTETAQKLDELINKLVDEILYKENP